jgi:predicted glycoside hydrolase/deacetylase ChbG (UPF0249 family)
LKTEKQLIINADDLGFSLGVNEAVKDAHLNGYLSHASLMSNTEFFQHAVENIIPECPRLKIGFHVNLTCGKSLYKGNVLAKNGKLEMNFLQLLFLRKTKKVVASLEKEIEAQLLEIKKHNIQIEHIDGHEHVHIIPSINKIVKKLAKKNNISRIREINEDFKFNFRATSAVNFVKLLVLRFLSLFNQNKKQVKFYSILNTCRINERQLFNYLENTKDENIEIMLHPSKKELDKNHQNLNPRFSVFLQSDYRTQEYELCFCEKFKKYTS